MPRPDPKLHGASLRAFQLFFFRARREQSRTDVAMSCQERGGNGVRAGNCYRNKTGRGEASSRPYRIKTWSKATEAGAPKRREERASEREKKMARKLGDRSGNPIQSSSQSSSTSFCHLHPACSSFLFSFSSAALDAVSINTLYIRPALATSSEF